MEKRCLEQLDSVENWEKFLKTSKPSETEFLNWRPFIKIFLFNVVFLGVIVMVLIAGVAVGTLGIETLKEDWPLILAFNLFVSIVAAIYTTNLYRRSWNRRAQKLQFDN